MIDIFLMVVMLLRWLTVVACVITTSPYPEFYEEFPMMKSPRDFEEEGEEDYEPGGE